MATSVHLTLKGFDQLPVKWVGWLHAEGDGQPLLPRGQALANSQGRPEGQVLALL